MVVGPQQAGYHRLHWNSRDNLVEQQEHRSLRQRSKQGQPRHKRCVAPVPPFPLPDGSLNVSRVA